VCLACGEIPVFKALSENEEMMNFLEPKGNGGCQAIASMSDA
jgi:hypothetical protein